MAVGAEGLVNVIRIIPRVSATINRVMDLKVFVFRPAENARPVVSFKDLEALLLPARITELFGVCHNVSSNRFNGLTIKAWNSMIVNYASIPNAP